MKKHWTFAAFMLLFLLPACAGICEAAEAQRATIDLTPLFQAILALLASLITARLVPWVKGKTTAQQEAVLRAVCDVLVSAAEQLYKTQQITDRMDYVTRQLAQRGYTIDLAQIEAAVRRMQARKEAR